MNSMHMHIALDIVGGVHHRKKHIIEDTYVSNM